jgi:uncharacterized protein
MPITPTYPGVYVQEVPSGVRTIVGVSTSVAMFLGTSKKGPISRPIQCLNYASFRDRFGDDPTGGRLAQYIKLFFLNGGTNCYVMRIANGATAATVSLQNEGGVPVLRLDAKDLGQAGENIRAIVTYNGPQPEVTFNLELFQWEVDSTGRRTKKGNEIWRNLSMDPASPGYAPDFITQNSQLVNATDLNAVPVPLSTAFGFSLSGRAMPVAGSFQATWSALLGSTANTNRFQISIRGSPFIDVDLSSVVVPGIVNTLLDAIGTTIQNAFVNKGITNIIHKSTGPGPGNFTVRFHQTLTATGQVRRLRIDCFADNGDVFIRPGTTVGTQRDLAVPLMLGTEQGGLEISGLENRRPAPNGITLHASDPAVITTLAGSQQQDPTRIDLESIQSNGVPVLRQVNLNLITGVATDLISLDNVASSAVTGHSDGVREKLQMIADAVNTFIPPAGDTWPWKAEVWGNRLAVRLTDAAPDNFISGFAFITTTPLPAGAFTNNVHLDTVGIGGNNTGLQTSAAGVASDGTPPLAVDYDNAYPIIDREVDLFNLLVLSPDAAVAIQNVYGNASVFCRKRRAFLLMDPPASWTDVQTAAGAVATLRIGLVKDYSAVFFPRVTVDEAGLKVNVGPAGAIAGLCARIDSTRGVWKAPAGTEADLRGVVGLERQFSDDENGVLNPKAINTLRIFPNGIVNWGARTNDGSDDNPSDWKYIPVRRLALFIEESLYRGLKWVVFEPNDEPLWAQIRLNVGAFMHNLFRQGAFQGATPRVAYFVKCDSETTTQNDINLGIVNIWVGFAPLKPAEFVILYLQQMAGQIQT